MTFVALSYLCASILPVVFVTMSIFLVALSLIAISMVNIVIDGSVAVISGLATAAGGMFAAAVFTISTLSRSASAKGDHCHSNY